MSRLLENSKEYRQTLLAKNKFTNNDDYNAGHPNALSDGDEWGKGEKAGSIGGATDIRKREELLSKSIYNKNKEYNSSNA